VRIVGDYDVVLIGGGVAGYVAAIKAGQEGMKVGKLVFDDSLSTPILTAMSIGSLHRETRLARWNMS
jgi:thioredoxin reductase